MEQVGGRFVRDGRTGRDLWEFQCACGAPFTRRPKDLLTSSGVCAPCARSQAQQAVAAAPAGRQRLRAIGLRGANVRAEERRRTLAARLPGVPWEVWQNVLQRCRSAKHRCKASRCASFPDYGGRGIEFRFKSASDMATYLLSTAGPPPAGFEIDRCDNNGHYEEGNLRWVDISTQNNNKRKYKRRRYGGRMDALLEARPDYTYEGLRRLINKGWSDERIIHHRKGSHVRYR